MTKTTNIMIVGVGGQGSLLASRIMGHVLMAKGFDVKVSEVHGMSQRGGSVVTYVRYGEKVYSPIVDMGDADVIIAFEQLEALRWLPYLKKDGVIIINTQKIDPMPVIAGVAKYPENIIEKITALGIKVNSLNALDLAVKAGAAKAANVVLLGKMATSLDIAYEEWIEAIKECVPAKFTKQNIEAFENGYNA